MAADADRPGHAADLHPQPLAHRPSSGSAARSSSSAAATAAAASRWRATLRARSVRSSMTRSPGAPTDGLEGGPQLGRRRRRGAPRRARRRAGPSVDPVRRPEELLVVGREPGVRTRGRSPGAGTRRSRRRRCSRGRSWRRGRGGSRRRGPRGRGGTRRRRRRAPGRRRRRRRRARSRRRRRSRSRRGSPAAGSPAGPRGARRPCRGPASSCPAHSDRRRRAGGRQRGRRARPRTAPRVGVRASQPRRARSAARSATSQPSSQRWPRAGIGRRRPPPVRRSPAPSASARAWAVPEASACTKVVGRIAGSRQPPSPSTTTWAGALLLEQGQHRLRRGHGAEAQDEVRDVGGAPRTRSQELVAAGDHAGAVVGAAAHERERIGQDRPVEGGGEAARRPRGTPGRPGARPR